MMHIALTIDSKFVRYCAVTIVSILEKLPFLLHKSQCEGLPGSRKKTFIALPAATLSGAKTTRPAESQGKSDWTG